MANLYKMQEDPLTYPSINDFIDPKPVLDFPSCQNDELVDEKIEFKKIIDGFIIYELLQSEESKFKFLNLVFMVFNNLTSMYNKLNNLVGDDMVKFVYKGGNLMRILKKKYLSGPVFDSILQLNSGAFIDSFSKSDDDFTIKINPSLPNFDKIQADMQYLTYKGLLIVRRLLTYDQFDFSKLTKNAQHVTLYQKVFLKVNAAKCLIDPNSPYNAYRIVGVLFADTYVGVDKWETIDSIAGFTSFEDDTSKPSNFIEKQHDYKLYGSKRKDFAILKSNRKNLNAIHMFTNTDFYSDTKSILPEYITYNDTLTFKKLNDAITSFVLARVKLNVRIFMVKDKQTSYIDVGGELIDISIAKQRDIELTHFYSDLANMHTYVRNYTFEDSGTKKSFTVEGYTIDYIIEDLLRILLGDTKNRPWTDSKYDRRLSRLYVLYLIKMLYDNSTTYSNKITQLNAYISKLQSIQTTDPTDPLIGQELADLDTITKRIPIMAETTTYINYIYTKYAFDFRHNYELDKKEINECTGKIIDKIGLIEIVLSHLVNDHKIQTLQPPDDVNIQKEFFGGAFYDKYIKYKIKYCALKKQSMYNY